MADTTPDTPAAAPAVETPAAEVERIFVHDVALESYVAGLKAELRVATKNDHKAAIKAELEAIIGARAVRPADRETR